MYSHCSSCKSVKLLNNFLPELESNPSKGNTKLAILPSASFEGTTGLKDRENNYEIANGKDNKTQDAMSKEEVGTPSPLTKSTNPHPDPKRK